jgi:phospholipid transport system substrate-binding protein
LLLFVGLAAAPRPAAAQQSAAEAFIADLGREAMQVLGPSVPPGIRTTRFRELFRNDFDMPEIAQFVLGPYRRSLTPQQQAEFRNLLTVQLAHTYADKLKAYAGDRFKVYASRPWGGGTLVYSRVLRPDGNPVELDWVVVSNGGRLAVNDVFVQNVSMKLAKRDELVRVAQRNGGDPGAIIAALRQGFAFGS